MKTGHGPPPACPPRPRPRRCLRPDAPGLGPAGCAGRRGPLPALLPPARLPGLLDLPGLAHHASAQRVGHLDRPEAAHRGGSGPGERGPNQRGDGTEAVRTRCEQGSGFPRPARCGCPPARTVLWKQELGGPARSGSVWFRWLRIQALRVSLTTDRRAGSGLGSGVCRATATLPEQK